MVFKESGLAGRLGVPPQLIPAIEQERKNLTLSLDERCKGFGTNHDAIFETQEQMSKRGKSKLLPGGDIYREGIYLRDNPASSLAPTSPAFGSDDALAYKNLLQAAVKEIAIMPTTSSLINSLTNQYLVATAFCSNNMDCSQTSLMFAENCMKLGVCTGASVDDALRTALQVHGIDVSNLSALARWVRGEGTWAQLIAPLIKKGK